MMLSGRCRRSFEKHGVFLQGIKTSESTHRLDLKISSDNEHCSLHRQDQMHEPSYLPFLFPTLHTAPSPSADEIASSKWAGRRSFSKGKEVMLNAEISTSSSVSKFLEARCSVACFDDSSLPGISNRAF